MIAYKDTAVAGVIFSIAALALALFSLGPLYSGYTLKSETLKNLESVRTGLIRQAGGAGPLKLRISELEKEINNLKDRIHQIRSGYIKKGDTQTMLSIIGRSASRSGADIVFVDAKPWTAPSAYDGASKNPERPSFGKAAISLRLESGYRGISEFIGGLLDAPYTLRVEKLIVAAKDPGASGRLAADIELEITGL